MTVVDLQPLRQTTSAAIRDPSGQAGIGTLTNLQPQINVWFLVELNWNSDKREVYHIENLAPERPVRLDAEFAYGLVVGREAKQCSLWSEVKKAQASRDVYAPLCNGRLFLRNATKGHKTSKEWATDFLRLYVPGGEKITTFVRGTLYKDAFLNTSELIEAMLSEKRARPPGAPVRPLINPQYENHYLIPDGLGIDVNYEVENRMLAGRWYTVRDMSGVFVSAVQPKLVADEVVQAQKNLVKPLDEVEAGALCYLVAFDLAQYDLRFALGTEHPQVHWSGRVMAAVKNDALPGPDGIGSVAPLVNTGLVNPAFADGVAATFTGGFKRYHGAFSRGDLGMKNHGSHYGFVENGVVLSRLQPGLATAIIYAKGDVEIKTWTGPDSVDFGRIRYARQNGVPIVEPDPATRLPRPGALVPGAGNWSGSVDGRYRTLRAGLAMQESEGNRFLIFGYFSSATPSAMARVFQAYKCQYAMLTDMNALEHTYMALYPAHQDSGFVVQHLIKGMSVLDKVNQGQVVPRFVGYADNRDFFYLLKKEMP